MQAKSLKVRQNTNAGKLETEWLKKYKSYKRQKCPPELQFLKFNNFCRLKHKENVQVCNV